MVNNCQLPSNGCVGAVHPALLAGLGGSGRIGFPNSRSKIGWPVSLPPTPFGSWTDGRL